MTDTPSPRSPDPSDIGDLDDVIGFHVRLLHAKLRHDFKASSGDLDLTQKQVSTLWLIDAHPEIAQADIGRRLRMDRATVMAIVNRLQERGFLVRAASAGDRRRQTLALTESGRAILATARDRAMAYERSLRARFTPAEGAMLIELLRRLHD